MKAEIVENKQGEKRLLLTFECAEERAFFRAVPPPRTDWLADEEPSEPDLRAILVATSDGRLHQMAFVQQDPFIEATKDAEIQHLTDELAHARATLGSNARSGR